MFDIVFCGLNEDGEYIVGSLIEEDDDEGVFKHMHSVVYEVVFNSFKLGYVSYLQLLEGASDIYLIDTKYSNGEQTVTKQIKFEDIPKDCLPLKDSFLPKKK